MIRVLLADDHALVRKGLIQILERQRDLGVFGEAGTIQETLEQVRAKPWDIILLDLAFPDGSGVDALREIRTLQPALPVLILTMFPEDQLALRMLKAGAAGYLTKESAPDELVKAIRLILEGHKYVSPAMAQALADGLSPETEGLPHEQLSHRELEVMRLVAAGKHIKEIGEALRLSPKTVTTYRARVLKKMRMSTNAELTYYATQHGLLTAPMLRSRDK